MDLQEKSNPEPNKLEQSSSTPDPEIVEEKNQDLKQQSHEPQPGQFSQLPVLETRPELLAEPKAIPSPSVNCSPCICDADTYKITVKFRLDDSHIIAQVYDNHMLLTAILSDLATKFRIEAQFMQVNHAQIECVGANVRLGDLPTNEFSIVELDLSLSGRAIAQNAHARRRNELLRLDPEVFYRHYHLPEFFVVHISDEQDRSRVAKRLIVEIVSQPIVKHFVGGYRDTRTDIEYHDAYTQTGPHADSIRYEGIVSRPTQTMRTNHKLGDTAYDRASQAFGTATELIYVPAVTDYTIVPGPYESFEQAERRINRLGKICLIQRNFRRWLLQKRIREAAAEYRRRFALQKSNEHAREEQLLNLFKKECTIKTFPQSREDFNLLTVQIHKWKQAEIRRIDELAFGAPRIALLHAVLDKEIQLLNVIEKKWFALRAQKTAERNERKLEEMGRPVKWVGYKNVIVEMDLLRTQKIRYLLDVYRQMKMPPRSVDERLQLIEKLLNLLQDEEASKSRDELIELILRERNMLSHNIKGDALKPLRQRQTHFMVNIIETYDKVVKSIPDNDDKTKLFCKQCQSVRPVTDILVNTRQKQANVCLSCTLLKTPPIDFTIYREILRSIQRDERRRGALASFAFVARDNDIRELIDIVWHGHSVISQTSDHTELKLPRWLRGDDWSPWNCVCLTAKEAQAHVKLVHLEQLYDEALLAKIQRKHALARTMFSKMDLLNRDFVESKEWWLAGLNGTVV